MKNSEFRTGKGIEIDRDFRQLRIEIMLTTLLTLPLLCSCTQSTSPPLPPVGSDTTSHEFTWHIDTLGDGNSSTLYDVAIIGDSIVWAVGALYLKDSNGAIEPMLYNVARWDGKVWSLSRGGLSPFHAVYAFSPNDVWAGTSAPYHWDGAIWQSYNVTGIFGGYIQKMWGMNSNDIYIAGTNGSIAVFNGATWMKLESGTTVDFQDIWGSQDISTDSTLVLCPSSFVFQDAEKKNHRISENNVVDTIAWGTGRRVSSVWFDSPDQLFASGGGVFVRHGENSWNEVTELPLIYTRRVRGTAPNDVMVVGDFGFCAHFNGSTWKYYTGNEVPSFSGSWLSVAMTENLVVAVGLVGDRAVVLRGVR